MLKEPYCLACGTELPEFRIRQNTPFCNLSCQQDHHRGKRFQVSDIAPRALPRTPIITPSSIPIFTETTPVRRRSHIKKKAIFNPKGCTGQVYLLYNPLNGQYKIGTTNLSSKQRRLRITMTAGIQMQLVDFWNVEEAGRSTEIYLHGKFAEYRQIGEWFQFPANMCEEDVRSLIERAINGA